VRCSDRSLPQGYETALGKWFDAGVNLSARVAEGGAGTRLHADARILLLMSRPRARRASGVRAVRTHPLADAGRHPVYISHRFSTVRRADRIVFLSTAPRRTGNPRAVDATQRRYARLFRCSVRLYRVGHSPEMSTWTSRRPRDAAGWVCFGHGRHWYSLPADQDRRGPADTASLVF